MAVGAAANDARHDKETTRLDIAKGLILQDQAKLLSELEKHHKVRLYLVSSATRKLADVDRPRDLEAAVKSVRGIEPQGSQSRLGDGVRNVLTELRGAPPSAIVLFTDGQTTEGEPLSKAAALAAQKGVPIFAVGLGSAEPARDIELTELLVDDVVFVDDTVRFQAKLLARGFEGEKVVVRLKELEPGSRDPKTARELEKVEVDAPPNGQPKRVELVHHPKTTGERTYILEVDKKPRELQVENNLIERMVTVRKEKLKVLFVDSEPRYEFRYLKNYLERDETIDLNIVLLVVRSGVQPARPLCIADISRRQGRPVRLRRRPFRRCRHQLPESVADAKPGRVRQREGGRSSVHRRRAV